MRRLLLLRWYLFGAGLGLMVLVSGALTWANFSATTANNANSFSAAASFCVSPGTTSVVTTDYDSYVDQGGPTSNFGTANPVKTDGNSTKTKRVYVHFSLPTPPHNCTVSSAVLRYNCTVSISGRTLSVYQASGSWTEAGITWNNQPGTTGSASNTAAATGFLSFTVTTQTQALYSGTNTGYVMRDSNEASAGSAQSFTSDESASNKADLTITWG